MRGGTYKKILEQMPEGVFVFDDKLRVKYTNAAFRRLFAGKAKASGSLAQAIACKETGGCGNGAACAYCTFLRLMREAIADGAEKTETVRTTMRREGHTDRLSVRIRVSPAQGAPRLYIGLTDGTYSTELEREVLSAQQVQRRLLPAGKSVGGVPYAYMYIPRYGVGGDLPDVYELNGQTYGVLSDVAGKGISAGLLSAFVKAGLNRKEENLARALSELSAKFNELNQEEQSYITVSAVRIDLHTQTLSYAVAGHNVPILLKNAVGINEIESPAPPISNWMPNFPYRENALRFERGDLLVMMTDGVTECTNTAGEQFGIERAESVLLQSNGAEDFIGKLRQALNVFCGGNYSDDVTAVAFEL